jgi:hypothetical protein
MKENLKTKRTKKKRKGRGLCLCIEKKKNHNSCHRSSQSPLQQHHNTTVNVSTTKAAVWLAYSLILPLLLLSPHF